MFLSNADAFKNLDALFIAFLDLDVDFDRVTRFEGREAGPQLLTLNLIHCVHKCL